MLLFILVGPAVNVSRNAEPFYTATKPDASVSANGGIEPYPARGAGQEKAYRSAQ